MRVGLLSRARWPWIFTYSSQRIVVIGWLWVAIPKRKPVPTPPARIPYNDEEW